MTTTNDENLVLLGNYRASISTNMLLSVLAVVPYNMLLSVLAVAPYKTSSKRASSHIIVRCQKRGFTPSAASSFPAFVAGTLEI